MYDVQPKRMPRSKQNNAGLREVSGVYSYSVEVQHTGRILVYY